jgi:hypothetical protein
MLAAMDATAAEVRAWAAGNGYELGTKGRIPEEVRAAFELARNQPADDDGETAEIGEPEALQEDPPPSRAGKIPPPRQRRPKITADTRKDIRGKVGLLLTLPAMMIQRRDEACGTVLVGQVPEISDALVELICDSPDLVAFFTGGQGRYMKYLALATALEPVATVAWQHHVVKRIPQGGGPDQGWDGDTVPPDMSRYHAPAL